MQTKIPFNLKFFVIVYSIMFVLTSYIALWQFTQGFIVINQFLIVGFALICLVADILSIRQIVLIKKGKTKEKINE